MKIEIKNLGPISKFNFDVDKDLHLIYGKNSVGKSYAIYCVYILLKKFNESQARVFYRNLNLDSITFKSSLNDLYNKLKNIAEENKWKRVEIGSELSELLTSMFNEMFSDEITDSFNNTFSSLGTLKNTYSNKKPEITISNNGISGSFFIDKSNRFQAKSFFFDTSFEIIKEKRVKTPILYLGNLDWAFGEMGSDADLGNKMMYLLDIFKRQIQIDNIYFLPSSRSGLYLALSSFAPIIAELSKHRFQLKSKIELPSISEPISDYFIPLANANSKKTTKEFDSIIKQLEEDILQGSVLVDNENKRILFQPKDSSLKLDLSASSSMVSEIAPIVTYFKHIINIPQNGKIITSVRGKTPKSIIFIEEPEAHLHPEIQVRLMEIFAELTKHNMKVVITSHSNYMFNKLVNMILAKKVDVEKVVVNNMVMTKLGSVVDENMTVTEDGVEDFNFTQTSEKLYEERMNIVD